jgi:hypothetical protein
MVGGRNLCHCAGVGYDTPSSWGSMTARERLKHASLLGSFAEWTAVIASLALIAGIVVATVRVAPAQDRAPQAPALQKPEADAPKQSPSLPATGESLSERLGRADGVIKPPSGVDPGMHVAPKDPSAGSTMPVIPPPGSPGGDQSIRPK